MRKWVRRIAIWGLVIVSLLAIAWTAVLINGKQRLDNELAYWRDQGLEVPIEAGFNIRTDETGTPRILRVIELYKDVPAAKLELIDDPDKAEPTELAKAVASCEDILLLIHEVAAEEQAVWREEVLDSEAWLDDLVARLNHPRSIARLLDAEALVRARAGDLDGACESIVAGLSIARQVGEHPAMIAVMVEVAMVEMMTARLESIYKQGGVPTEPVLVALNRFDVDALFVSTLKWEGVYMTRVTTGHAATPWSMHDTAYALRRYRGKVERIEVHGASLSQVYFFNHHPWWAMQYKQVEPVLRRFKQSLLLMKGRVEVARQAIFLRQYHREHGSYPDTLDELAASGLYLDSEAILKYRTTDGGFELLYYPGTGSKGRVWRWE